MTDKAEDVIARLERLMTLNTNSASQTRDDALTLIAAQAAEIERLTACVAEYIVQIDEIASQAAEIAALKEIVKNDGDVLIRAGVLFDKDRIITAQAAEIERLRATLITIVHQSNDWSEAIHKELASLGIQVEPKEGGMTDKVHDVLARLRRQLEYPNNASTAIHPDFAAVARSDLSEVLALIADIKDD